MSRGLGPACPLPPSPLSAAVNGQAGSAVLTIRAQGPTNAVAEDQPDTDRLDAGAIPAAPTPPRQPAPEA
jgi:hypothetical protein